MEVIREHSFLAYCFFFANSWQCVPQRCNAHQALLSAFLQSLFCRYLVWKHARYQSDVQPEPSNTTAKDSYLFVKAFNVIFMSFSLSFSKRLHFHPFSSAKRTNPGEYKRNSWRSILWGKKDASYISWVNLETLHGGTSSRSVETMAHASSNISMSPEHSISCNNLSPRWYVTVVLSCYTNRLFPWINYCSPGRKALKD